MDVTAVADGVPEIVILLSLRIGVLPALSKTLNLAPSPPVNGPGVGLVEKSPAGDDEIAG